MMERVPEAGIGTVGAIRNRADDAGYGAGPAAFGLFVGHTGYPAGLALTGVLMIAALPAARPRRGGHRGGQKTVTGVGCRRMAADHR
jgi:hypothetical protein